MADAEEALKWVEHRDALHAPYLGQLFHKSAESSGASVTDLLRPRKYRMLIMDHKTRGTAFCIVNSVAPTYQPGFRTHPLRINGSETLSSSDEQNFFYKPHFNVNFGACVSKWNTSRAGEMRLVVRPLSKALGLASCIVVGSGVIV